MLAHFSRNIRLAPVVFANPWVSLGTSTAPGSFRNLSGALEQVKGSDKTKNESTSENTENQEHEVNVNDLFVRMERLHDIKIKENKEPRTTKDPNGTKTETKTKPKKPIQKTPKTPKTGPAGPSTEQPPVTKDTGSSHLLYTKNHTSHPKESKVESVGTLDFSKVPRLAHRLDRTLFSPGVHFLQDPRTRIYNFTPYLKKIIKLEDFNFDMIETFISVSKDKVLLEACSQNNKKYYSSTSSMTSTLSKFYRFLNNYNPMSPRRFPFPKFSRLNIALPSSLVIAPQNNAGKDTIYSVEVDKSTDQEILLGALGHCLEALLTNEEKEFAKFDLNYKNEEIFKQQESNVYNYATYGNFLMRSQLDCYDERLPGNGTFDIKTRAVCAIRYDSSNPELANNTYQIWKLSGKFESFEREYEDLIKSGALLKYAFQARIGQMDGIFLAYHNVNSFFGFQYLPLSELDEVFYGNKTKIKSSLIESLEDLNDDLPSYWADLQFKVSLEIWEKLLEQVIEDIDNHPEYKDERPAFRLVMNVIVSDIGENILRVLALPLSNENVEKIKELPLLSKTSYNENFTQVKMDKLKAHEERLGKFNESTVKDAKMGMLNYTIRSNYYINGKMVSNNYTPYPRSKNDDVKVEYSIQRLKTTNPKHYLNQLDRAVKTISLGFDEANMIKEDSDNQGSEGEFLSEGLLDINERDKQNDMRVYSAVGKARAKAWDERDNNPVVYEPR